MCLLEIENSLHVDSGHNFVLRQRRVPPSAWAEVRDDSNPSVDWIIVGYEGSSKTDITLLDKGSGGINACSAALPEGRPVFGGCRRNGRFVTFYYTDEKTPTLQRGRASMHKNGKLSFHGFGRCNFTLLNLSAEMFVGVLNVLEGSDGEIDMIHTLTETEALLPDEETSPAFNGGDNPKSTARKSVPSVTRSEPESNSPATQVPHAIHPIQPLPEGTYSRSEPVIFLYSDLRGIVDASNLPQGVDPLNREQSLSDDEFAAVFAMGKEAFHRLPAWKRTSLKKQFGLF